MDEVNIRNRNNLHRRRKVVQRSPVDPIVKGVAVVVNKDIYRVPSNRPDIKTPIGERTVLSYAGTCTLHEVVQRYRQPHLMPHELYASRGDGGVVEDTVYDPWWFLINGKQPRHLQVRMSDGSLKTFRSTSLTIVRSG